jgi:putative heme-binding domain-containing protein
MRRGASGGFALILLVARLAHGQGAPATVASNEAETIRAGQSYYQTRCSDCHGVDARGVLGPDLTQLWTSGATDERVFQTIRRGVPGSEMPASTAPDEEIRATMSYLHSLATPVPADSSTGDAGNGERIFWRSCGPCHQVNGRGGRLGPDLSRVGSSRPRAALTREIRDPSASIVPGYQTVTIVTATGQRIRGVRKSEDAFSIQIMDTSERLQGYLKGNLREVIPESRSLMPEFRPDRLNDRDLDDLLRFLGRLRGPEAGRP